jgi:uncharacterized protein YndB with AHSA1/START domain
MADIFLDFPINAPRNRVFDAISTADGLAKWWTKRTTGKPRLGCVYELWFGPEYDWRAVVSIYVEGTEFEFEIKESMKDWEGTQVGFRLEESKGVTQVRFHHTGWPEANDHFRGSTFCWALYLRLLKRYVEFGEVVPYEDRENA